MPRRIYLCRKENIYYVPCAPTQENGHRFFVAKNAKRFFVKIAEERKAFIAFMKKFVQAAALNLGTGQN